MMRWHGFRPNRLRPRIYRLANRPPAYESVGNAAADDQLIHFIGQAFQNRQFVETFEPATIAANGFSVRGKGPRRPILPPATGSHSHRRSARCRAWLLQRGVPYQMRRSHTRRTGWPFFAPILRCLFSPLFTRRFSKPPPRRIGSHAIHPVVSQMHRNRAAEQLAGCGQPPV